MMVFRNGPPFAPFLWESDTQPEARWHGTGEGPVQYFANCSDAAWAEFLRHEGITDPADLDGVVRALWAVEIPDDPLPDPTLDQDVMVGGEPTYPSCRAEARRLRTEGEFGLTAPSAALVDSQATPWRVDGGLVAGAVRDARTIVLFGLRPDLEGWKVAHQARPHAELLPRVNHLA